MRTWEPVLPRAKVGCGPGLPRLEHFNGAAGNHKDAQTSRASDGLLRGSENDVEFPLVKLDLLAADTADTVHNDQSLWADPVHKLAESLELAQHTGRGIHVGDSQKLVLLLLERLLDFVELWSLTNGGLELGGLHAVRLQAVGERVGKVSSVQDESLVARLGKVRGDLVPAKGSGTGNDKGLRGGIGGLEELPQAREDLAEGVYKGLADVRLAVSVSGGACTSRPDGGIPVVAHGLENCIVKLNGAWDH